MDEKGLSIIFIFSHSEQVVRNYSRETISSHANFNFVFRSKRHLNKLCFRLKKRQNQY